MTPDAFRAVIADMLEHFGHTIVTNPNAADLVTTKQGRKFVTACATPADLRPTGTRERARLHEAVIAANAARGFFVTARSFTGQAEKYAERSGGSPGRRLLCQAPTVTNPRSILRHIGEGSECGIVGLVRVM